jgi:hypothetical protein
MKMRLARWMTGIGLGTLAVAGLFVAPALQAQESRIAKAAKRQVSGNYRGLGTFTPAAADPKLAAVLARSGLPDNGFRFTPSESRRSGSQAVTVAVRARSTRTAQVAERTNPAPAPLSLAPVAYNLGVSVGWKRFAVSGDVMRVDLVNQPGSRERADFGLSYNGKRAGGRIQAGAERPLSNTPALIGDNPSYSIDVGGSYSLTRNFDVTAGVRYKAERDRLPRLTDDRRDSQAVYVGTAFRF